MRWHFFRTEPARGTYNMALDEALMRESQRTGNAYFRLYGWASPTLSLGRNQRARGLYDLAAAQRLGVGFVRRPTGGRALLHHREITYSVTLPAKTPADASAAYTFINEVLLEGLRGLGVNAAMATGTAHEPPGPRPCFDVPSEHEIVVDDRKLIGSAQWRHDDMLLQHGSILVQDDQGLIAQMLKQPLAAMPIAATLAHVLGRDPSMDEVAPAMRRALEQRIDASVREYDPEELRDDVSDCERTYVDDNWTWRR